jgi:hypothetical protein
VVAVTAAPYALGYSLQVRAARFHHNLKFDHDYNAYYSFIRQSRDGLWLFHNQFTPEPHENCFFDLEWLAAGKLAALTGLRVEIAFHVLGALATPVWACSLYWLASLLFATVLMRRLVFSMVLLGGGFGWLTYYFGVLGGYDSLYIPLDCLAGLHPFFCIFFQPHFLLAQAFFLLAVALFLRAEHTGRTVDYLWAGLACAVAGLIRPYELLYISVALALYVLVLGVSQGQWARKRLVQRLLVILIGLPVLAYYYLLFTYHPVFRWWGVQGVRLPFLVSSVALGMGLTFVLLLCSLAQLGGFRDKTAPRSCSPA